MRYFILTLGCQMNKSDSERIARILENLNYKKTDDEKSADLIVANSCSVRQSAIDRIFGKTRIWNREKIRRCKESEPQLVTVLTGCVLPEDRKKLEKLFDFVLDIKDLTQLSQLLARIKNQESRTKKKKQSTINNQQLTNYNKLLSVTTSYNKLPSTTKDYFQIPPIYQTNYSAFVPIITGCNNFCAYCAVPYTRGREVSRNVKEILTEVKNLVNNGCVEIILLGQNVNTFQKSEVENPALNRQLAEKGRKSDKQPQENKKTRKQENELNYNRLQVTISYNKLPSVTNTTAQNHLGFSKNNPYQDPFAALLWEINQIPGLNRVHFTAPHPKNINDEVIDALTLSKHVNFLHLPVQSGDDEILKKMNRNYTAADYLKLIKKIKKKRPNIALGTDIIVGFPGETKKQFNNTVKLYKKAEFDISYTAKYSPRPGTAAAKFKDSVSIKEKKRRWKVLQKLMEETTLKKNRQYVGQEVEVLVDKVVGWFPVVPQNTGNQNALAATKSASRFGVSAAADSSEPAAKYLYEGNSREYKRVRFYSKEKLLGKIVKVKIKKAMTWMLEGEIANV